VTITGNKIDTFDTYKEWNLFGEVILGADLLIAKRLPLTITLSFDQSLANLAHESNRNTNLIFDYGFVQPKINMSSASLSLFYFIK
jgi:hypothetical protein